MDVNDRIKESGDRDVTFRWTGKMALVPMGQPFIGAGHGGLPTHFPVWRQLVQPPSVVLMIHPSAAWKLLLLLPKGKP